MAVPTRIIVEPSCTATSKSWLMPIESSRRRSGGTPTAASPSRSSRRRRNQGRASSGLSASGGSSISPDEPGGAEIRLRTRIGPLLRGHRTWSPRRARSTCTRSSGAVPASAAAASTRRSSSTLSIEWMAWNAAAARRALLDLEVADEMPAKRQVGRVRDLAAALLAPCSHRSRPVLQPPRRAPRRLGTSSTRR